LREEEAILNQVAELDAPEFPSANSRLTQLAVLQHHGVPTRLIDVTRDPLVALFFAAQDSVDDLGQAVDGAVVAIVDLGVRVTEVNGNVSLDPPTATYGVWQAPPVDGRIISQRGCFLVASPNAKGSIPSLSSSIAIPAFDPKGGKKQPVATIFTNWLKGGGKKGRPPKITPNMAMFLIPGVRKASLRRLLAAYGLNTRTIYPDLAGYASSFPPS
jgi:FRG domain